MLIWIFRLFFAVFGGIGGYEIGRFIQQRTNFIADKVYINDAKYDNNIDIGFRKQIVYFQFVAGISMFIKRK